MSFVFGKLLGSLTPVGSKAPPGSFAGTTTASTPNTNESHRQAPAYSWANIFSKACVFLYANFLQALLHPLHFSRALPPSTTPCCSTVSDQKPVARGTDTTPTAKTPSSSTVKRSTITTEASPSSSPPPPMEKVSRSVPLVPEVSKDNTTRSIDVVQEQVQVSKEESKNGNTTLLGHDDTLRTLHQPPSHPLAQDRENYDDDDDDVTESTAGTHTAEAGWDVVKEKNFVPMKEDDKTNLVNYQQADSFDVSHVIGMILLLVIMLASMVTQEQVDQLGTIMTSFWKSCCMVVCIQKKQELANVVMDQNVVQEDGAENVKLGLAGVKFFGRFR